MSLSSRRMILPDRVFGRSALKMMSSGRASAPILSATNCRRSSRSGRALLPSFAQRDERRDRLALELVRPADDRRLGDIGMLDERDLDFHRPDSMARDVQHIVDAAEHPEVAVVVALGAVAGEVEIRPPGHFVK